MKKVFLSTSFSGKVDYATGRVLPEFRKEIELILAALRQDEDLEVFCAVEDERWNITNTAPEVGVKYDLARLDSADLLLALVEETISAGVQFELGYAVAKGKQVVLASAIGAPVAYFNQGVVSNGMMTLITYEDLAGLIKQLDVALHAPEENV
ncbi:MAG: nucleoside 2-deoxyribosyltransferase [Patescibacteria group bacterium]